MTTPNPYLSKASLAKALEISESTVDELVRRGVLPKPARLSPGCIRWRWETVDLALSSLIPSGNACPIDEDAADVQRAVQAAKEGSHKVRA